MRRLRMSLRPIGRGRSNVSDRAKIDAGIRATGLGPVTVVPMTDMLK